MATGGSENTVRNWTLAIFVFVIAMAALDTHYIMPKYLVPLNPGPTRAWGSNIWLEQDAIWIPVKYLLCFIRFAFGWLCIMVADQVAFGHDGWGTAAASALIYYTLLVPYLVALSFFIEDSDGIPPGYKFFSFFIARSGAGYLDRSLGDRGETFNADGFDRTVREGRTDKYQSRMETEELKKAAERAKADAARIRAETSEIAEDEAARYRAAAEAARAAEEHTHAKARKSSWERRRTK